MSTENPELPTVPVLMPSDIKFYFSGGYYNNVPRSSLGGAMSSFTITSGSLNGLFDGVSTTEARTGDVEFRCMYLKNTSQTRKLLRAKLWVETTTSSPNTSVAVSVGSAGVNGTEPSIPNEGIAPPMQFFSVPFSMPENSNIGDLFPGDSIGLWVRWTVNPDTASIENDYCVLRLDGEREPEFIYTPEESEGPPSGGCPSGTHWNPVLKECRPITEPVVCPQGLVYDETKQKCVLPVNPPPQGCPTNYHWDVVTGTCVPDTVPIVCPIGWTYDEAIQRCKPVGTNPPTVESLKFAATSDTTSGSDTLFSVIKQNVATTGSDPSFLCHAGDTTHSDGDVDPFIEFCATLGTMHPNHIFPAIGNHDDSEDGSGSETQDLIDAFPAMGTNGYYAVTRRNIRIIVMNTQEDYDEGSSQHSFVVSNLQQAASDAAIKWIIVTFHKPFVGSAGNHAFLSDMRDVYFPLFDQYHVDFIFNGHNHVYARTKPIKYNSSSPATPTIVINQSTGTYANIDGRVFISVASGDRDTGGGFSGSQEAWIAARDGSTTGPNIFTLEDNGNRIVFEHRSDSNQITDTCIFTKPGASPPTAIVCPTGYNWDESLGRCIVSPISCPTGQHYDPVQQMCVPDVIVPPPDTSGTYPVDNVEWFYDSMTANGLLTDRTLAAGDHTPDGVILSSGASGVSSHEISNGWINVETGGGNGRIYLDYHTLSRYSQDDQPGFNIANYFKFKWVGNDNVSWKDGNHGTGGYAYDGQLVFGGFGFSLHESETQSKVEYWHNEQGDEESASYPGNRTLEVDQEYKCFTTLRTDRVGQRVVQNVWLDFGDGTGWVKVLTDRVWSQSNWNPGSVPEGDDQSQIEDGPSFIKRTHIWIRNNSSPNPLPVTGIKIGTVNYIS